MTLRTESDLTLPLIPETALRNRGPVPTAAYVPITVALIGVFFILVGGLKSHDPTVTAAIPPSIDATITGAIDTR